ncbi:MAG: type II secretion system protein [Alphaproteobacteria bacterium]|nr:type II secretion system protein [Alphaproteobacteria bacterium]
MVPRGGIAERKASAGFTLVELSIGLVIVGILSTVLMQTMLGIAETQHRKITRQRLDTAGEALALFVAQNKRLPCPANTMGTCSNGGAGVCLETAKLGVESPPDATGLCAKSGLAGSGAGTQDYGILPFVTLGLAKADAIDGWGNYLTYRVYDGDGTSNTGSLVAAPPNGGLDMTWCDPAGSSPNILPYQQCRTQCTFQTCSRPAVFLAGKGLRVLPTYQDSAKGAGTAYTPILSDPVTLYTGAAYVLISHGKNGLGAMSGSSGIYIPTNARSGMDELANDCSNSVVSSRNGPGGGRSSYSPPANPGYIDGTEVSQINSPNQYFDDIVRHPTLMSVAARANLGPRSH